MIPILFVNHREKSCGVQQFGKRYWDALQHTKNYLPFYIDVEEEWEFRHWFDQIQPKVVIYNFYPSTLWWLSNELIDSMRPFCKQIGIYHEVDIRDKGFDLIVHQDPASEDDFPHWSLPRPLPEYTRSFDPPEIPTFGSFGFGLGGKGFNTLVQTVNEQYDRALVRLHIPFAAFGDADGAGARSWVEESRKLITKYGIELEVTHDFWDEDTLLDWLAHNTANCFFYGENYGRGISGTIDYALAVRRPLAITKSYQFKHIWAVDQSFLIENKTLPEIVAMGTTHLEKFHTKWSRERLVDAFEQALMSLGVMPS